MSSLPVPRRPIIKSKREDLYIRHKDVYIPTRDGSELCADLFLPILAEDSITKVPALLSMCPYGKDIHVLQWGLPQTDIYAKMNSKIKPLGPDAALEALDPLIWVRALHIAWFIIGSYLGFNKCLRPRSMDTPL